MIGQEENRAILSLYKEMPHFVILFGDKGSGRSTLIKEQCKNRSIECMEINGNIETIRAIITQSLTSTHPMCYIVDSETLTREAANALLKTCEETGPNTHLVLKAGEGSIVLDTLLSRALSLRMSPYSLVEKTQYLASIRDTFSINDEEIPFLLNYFTTPGDINRLLMTDSHGKTMIDFIIQVIDNIDTATDFNVMKIADRIAIKDEPEKYPLDLFLDLVMQGIDKLITIDSYEAVVRARRLAAITDKAIRKIGNSSLSKERILTEWLLNCNLANMIEEDPPLTGVEN